MGKIQMPHQGGRGSGASESGGCCWIDGNISTSARTRSSVSVCRRCWVVTRDKGEVEEEGGDRKRRCRWL